MIAEGEQTAGRWTNTEDLVSPVMHLPATGKQVTGTGMWIGRFAGGKRAEPWIEMDDLGLFQQLGLIPVPQPVG